MSAASQSDVNRAIDDAARGTGFQCTPVSWEDAGRGTVDGELSCWGSNISDVRLFAKSGALLYTCRSDNWNERIGYVSAKQVAVVVGNHHPGGMAPTPVTLHTYLANSRAFCAYAGLDTSEATPPLLDEAQDELFSIRFQTVFLPVPEASARDPQAAKLEFCTDVYNYNTRSDDDPRNVLLLCTAQGTSVQQDGSGEKKIYLHEVDPNGIVHRYWLEGEQSSHKVGGAQKETDEEKQAAAARGKATAIHIGTKAMGTRFNVQMLIQLPLDQKEPMKEDDCFWENECAECDDGDECVAAACYDDDDGCLDECAPMKRMRSDGPPAAAKVGVSRAARVSRGTEVEEERWPGLANAQPKRDPKQHGTITVTMYYTVSGGVPSPADVKAAIDDLNQLYASCPTEKRLAEATEVTSELTVMTMAEIQKKILSQPYGGGGADAPFRVDSDEAQ